MAKKKEKLPEGMWKRGRVYYARFRHRGQLFRKRLSTNKAAAIEMLNEWRARLDRAGMGILNNDYPLADLQKAWLADCERELRPATVRRYRQNLANVMRLLLVKRVSHLTPSIIGDYRHKRFREEDAPSGRTVDMEITALRTMINWGIEENLIGSNPIPGNRKKRGKSRGQQSEKRKVRRALTSEELQTLFEVSPPGQSIIWRTLACTGMRAGELIAMRFEDIDFDAAEIFIHGDVAKNHEERRVPVDDYLLSELRRLKREAPLREPVKGKTPDATSRQLANFTREHVFTTEANTPWRNNLLQRFYTCAKKAGIKDAVPCGSVDVHSLRVSFVTLAIDSGANPKNVQAIVGHRTLGMTLDVYNKASADGKRQAVVNLPYAKAPEVPKILPMTG